MLQCFSLETPSWLLPVATICTQTDQDIKVAIIRLPPGCQPRLESQWVWHLCWNGSVSYSLQLPPSDLLSLHFRKQLFFHKLQSLGWQPTWQWQIAWGCSGTFPFIFAQSQHSLPGTTSVTRATTRAPRCQPCQLICASCSSCSPVRAAVGSSEGCSGNEDAALRDRSLQTSSPSLSCKMHPFPKHLLVTSARGSGAFADEPIAGDETPASK